MYTAEHRHDQIKSLKQSPITFENTVGLAALLYVDEKLRECPSDADAVGEPELTRAQAERWVAGMENADGTRGAHWSMEKSEEIRKQKGITIAPMAFWVTMNMMYSDYCMAAEKLGVNNAEFYVCMTKAFLYDADAQPDKLARYYEYIAEH